MKSTGKCPKCGGDEIYSDRSRWTKSSRSYVGISGMSQFTVDTYVCVNCGYLEEYAAEKYLKQNSWKDKIRSKWTPHKKYS